MDRTLGRGIPRGARQGGVRRWALALLLLAAPSSFIPSENRAHFDALVAMSATLTPAVPRF